MKVDLIKELQTNSDALKSDDNKIVQQVQKLLADNSQQEKETLRNAGLSHHIEVAENITGEALERKKFFEDFGHVITHTQIEKIGEEYALKCLNVTYFKGNIGPNVGAELTRFVEKHKLEAELKSGKLKRHLFILAPFESFKLEEKPKDPVLLYCPNFYTNGAYDPHKRIYIPIAKWGEDFTILRKINAQITPGFLFLFATATLSILAGLKFGLIGFMAGFIMPNVAVWLMSLNESNSKLEGSYLNPDPINVFSEYKD